MIEADCSHKLLIDCSGTSTKRADHQDTSVRVSGVDISQHGGGVNVGTSAVAQGLQGFGVCSVRLTVLRWLTATARRQIRGLRSLNRRKPRRFNRPEARQLYSPRWVVTGDSFVHYFIVWPWYSRYAAPLSCYAVFFDGSSPIISSASRLSDVSYYGGFNNIHWPSTIIIFYCQIFQYRQTTVLENLITKNNYGWWPVSECYWSRRNMTHHSVERQRRLWEKNSRRKRRSTRAVLLWALGYFLLPLFVFWLAGFPHVCLNEVNSFIAISHHICDCYNLFISDLDA